jgi:hypothetical protein
MGSKVVFFALSTAAILAAQDGPLNPSTSVRINLRDDSPISMLGANYDNSRATARGGALVLDLHMALTLRNHDPRRIRGITLLISAQEGAPGGRASQSIPTLDVGPGESFPVRIDVSLIRPLQAGAGPLVQVSLDGVLFESLDFYGPNRLNSRRSLTFWEMENRRDRKYLKQVLAAKGPEALQQEIRDSIARAASRQGLSVQMVQGSRSTTSASAPLEHMTQFAFLKLPDAPVQPVEGWAEVIGNEARDARIQVRNSSSATVRYIEIGWLLRDQEGKEFMAGSVPASETDLYLPPQKQGHLFQDNALKFSKGTGQPLNIRGMRGFVSQVEYGDGHMWVPSRESLISSKLIDLLPPSPEEQRLTDLYRKKGPTAVLEDLNRH